MGYFTAKQFSEIWGITERRIIKLCKEERISGAVKRGMVWEIPEGTQKPSDKRSNVYKYIHIPKKIMIVNGNEEIRQKVTEIIKKEGYLVECREFNWLQNHFEEVDQYYEGFIYFSIHQMNQKEEAFIMEFSKKLHSEGSIVIVEEGSGRRKEIEKKLAPSLKEEIGAKINTLILDIPKKKEVMLQLSEIAQDIVELLLHFKNTTGVAIMTDGGKIEFDKNRRTPNLAVGKFYQAINHCFETLNSESYLWCASTMLEDEWTESPQEMKFRLINLEAANRGVNIERIFLFRKDQIKEFKENKTLKIYMQSNIKTLFVDYDEISKNNPKLLEILGNGWDGINQETLIVDLPEESNKRGYLSRNEKEVMKAYECFEELKKYARDLKEVLK